MTHASVLDIAKNALGIIQGASNPRAVSRELVSAIDAGSSATGSTETGIIMTAPEYAPARLIMYQLGTIMGTGLTTSYSHERYTKDEEQCREYAREYEEQRHRLEAEEAFNRG